MSLRIVKQENSGVAAARNTGLANVSLKTDFIAFIDSDDIWMSDHLMTGLKALLTGYNFYFTDHKRRGHHESYFKELSPRMLTFDSFRDSISVLDVDDYLHILWRDFPSQASTVIYRYASAPNILFNTDLKSAGEDILFFTDLAFLAKSICFNKDIKVECAEGINMFFGHFDWDDPKKLEIIPDQIKLFNLLSDNPRISVVDREYLVRMADSYERDLVFFSWRYFAKEKTWPKRFLVYRKENLEKRVLWFSSVTIFVLLGRVCGFYRPVF